MEIQNVANMLRKDGKQAFFLRLEHIPNDFEDAFEVGIFDDFQKWLASGEERWLLLDSVVNHGKILTVFQYDGLV